MYTMSSSMSEQFPAHCSRCRAIPIWIIRYGRWSIVNGLCYPCKMNEEDSPDPNFFIDEGSSAYIENLPGFLGYVRKNYKVDNPSEKVIHARIGKLLLELYPSGILMVPALLQGHDDYVMQRISTEKPLWNETLWSKIPSNIKHIYTQVIKTSVAYLAEQGFFLRGVKVYLQSNETLMMIDFGEVHHIPNLPLSLESSTILPASVTSINWFD